MELRQAIAQVAEIREQLARTQVFRGYRSLSIALTGVVGLAAAAIQAVWLPQPAERLNAYLTLWVGAAAMNLLVVGLEIWRRERWAPQARRGAMVAVKQFVPCLAAGGLLTLVVAQRASEAAWMLPGLWSLLFGLGVFASCTLLPRAVALAGAWYVVAGTLALAWGQGDAALSPWIMATAFGGGQLATAVILHVTLEQPNRLLN